MTKIITAALALALITGSAMAQDTGGRGGNPSNSGGGNTSSGGGGGSGADRLDVKGPAAVYPLGAHLSNREKRPSLWRPPRFSRKPMINTEPGLARFHNAGHHIFVLFQFILRLGAPYKY
ncbi:hypothetical protein [Methylorubrum aminovorans]|uniref:hypothetical protein n=1 Tax=Methylorubrum aminovorans TaxID=269069 RepID=UPI0024E123A8|nr:hypothetical protein [Methylorubrum aminovorans]